MERVTFDITTLTLGEAAEAEEQSGKSLQGLMKQPINRLLLGLFVHELRSSEKPRSWRELSNLRLLDDSSSAQPSSSAETAAK